MFKSIYKRFFDNKIEYKLDAKNWIQLALLKKKLSILKN